MKARVFYSVANSFAAVLAVSAIILSSWAMAATDSTPVTIDNFVRAESDTAIQKVYDLVGLGKLFHIRTPTPLDQQNVIRMYRDSSIQALYWI